MKKKHDGIVPYENALLSSWGENLNGVIYRLEDDKALKLDLPSIKRSCRYLYRGDTLWIPRW